MGFIDHEFKLVPADFGIKSVYIPPSLEQICLSLQSVSSTRTYSCNMIEVEEKRKLRIIAMFKIISVSHGEASTYKQLYRTHSSD